MENLTKKAYRTIAPDPRELWARGGANVRSTEIDPGHYEDVPFFDDLEIAKGGVKPAKNGVIRDEHGKNIGDFRSFSVTTSDGIDRTARVYLPDDAHRSPVDMTIHADTALGTTITGHNDYRASMLAQETGLPLVFIGAEHGTNGMKFPLDAIRLPRTLKQSTAISLAKSTQSSQLITTHLLEKFDLSNTLIDIGESMGAMKASAHYVYAKEYGNTIAYNDITAPCFPDKLLADPAALMELAEWPIEQFIGTTAVGLEKAREGALIRMFGTVALNPNFITSNLVGVVPAIFSGEAGVFTRWMPRDAAMHVVTFKDDALSRPARWHELHADHKLVSVITLPGRHPHFATNSVGRHIAGRINNCKTEYSLTGGDVKNINWNNVHLKDNDIDHPVAA